MFGTSYWMQLDTTVEILASFLPWYSPNIIVHMTKHVISLSCKIADIDELTRATITM